jgi:hypothetical protein
VSTNDTLARYEVPLIDYPAKQFAEKARQLSVRICDKQHAVQLVRLWHSRLPKTQQGPWVCAFSAEYAGRSYAVALWNNPSARNLPEDWLELRRLAASADAPRNTCSFMLARMAEWFRVNRPDVSRLISYQDTAVHHGTIYKAANWQSAWVTKARVRDRSKPRVGTRRDYRSNLNGVDPDASEKVRWELTLKAAA